MCMNARQDSMKFIVLTYFNYWGGGISSFIFKFVKIFFGRTMSFNITQGAAEVGAIERVVAVLYWSTV